MHKDVLRCHFSVKMPFSPKKGQKGAKVGRAVGNNPLFCIFLKIGLLVFFILCIKLEGIKGYKLPQIPFFRNILIFWKKGSENRQNGWQFVTNFDYLRNFKNFYNQGGEFLTTWLFQACKFQIFNHGEPFLTCFCIAEVVTAQFLCEFSCITNPL